MAIILTRRGGLASLLAAMFLGVPMCQIASQIWIENPFWALVVGCVAGLAAWVLFILPADRITAARTASDPFDSLFDAQTLAWAARIGLTLCLVAGFYLVIIAVEGCLSPLHQMSTKGSFLAPVYRTIGIRGVSKATSGVWVALAFAGSLRPIRAVASSVRFFNQVALFVLLGALLLFRKALPTLTTEPFSWESLRIGPLWLYFSVAGLAAPALIARWEGESHRISWLGAVAAVAATVAIGSLVPTAYIRTLNMNGIGLTGSTDFLDAISYPQSARAAMAGKGVFLTLACFAWAQVAFLVFRGIWRMRTKRVHAAAVTFALLAWRPWVDPMDSNWDWNVGAAVAFATFLSVLAGITAGRALMMAWARSGTLDNVGQAERIAACAGGIVAVCAIVWPNTALDLAPFAASFLLMVSVAAIQSGVRGGLRRSME